jgi:dTDP-4-dehydrorhamnose 3,5-epimerase-like enzyme
MTEHQIIQLPIIQDPRGNLTFIQNREEIPFEIQRVFWTYDVPGGMNRGGHAYKNQKELIIALSGSFDVVVIDSKGHEKTYHLNRSYYGLYLPSNTWRHVQNFSTNALSLHLSDSAYNLEDYIYDLEVFRKEILK